MSLTKNVLLGGSSLLAAGLIAVFSPTTAAAQATCTSGTAVTGNGTNTVTIAGGNPNNPGVTCNYVGDNATVSTLASTTVSTLTPGGGINLTASGTDDIAWTSTAGTVTGGAQTNGPVISAINENGVITINTAGVTGSNATVSHGIYADSDTGVINITSTGTVSATNATSGLYGIQAVTGGAINITAATVSTARDGILAQSTGNGSIVLTTGSVGTGTAAAGNTAIEAISAGGAISVTTNGQIGTIGNSVAANTFNRDGIVATTSGAATVNLDINSSVAGFGAGGAAVRVTNGTGAVTIDASGTVSGGAFSSGTGAQLGSAFVIDSDGAITINSSSVIMGAINQTGAQPAAIVASGSSFTLTMTGNAATPADSVHAYQASLGGYYSSDGSDGGTTGSISDGMPDTLGDNRQTGGHVDLSGVTGGAELNFNTRARWVVTGTSVMSAGADEVNIDATSAIATAMQGSTNPLVDDVDQDVVRPGVINFGAGVDVVNNDGRIMIGPVYTSDTYVGEAVDAPPVAIKRFGIRGEARLLNLEQFNNAGDIWLGARFHRVVDTSIYITDQWHDDMLYMPGATFHGEEGSTIYMDVDFAKAQSGCAPATRDADGYLPAADCLGLQGGAATGATMLHVFEQTPGDRGSYNPDGIVLVDLAGGDPDDTELGAFFLDPTLPRYTDEFGENGAIEKGIFAFVLSFDAEDQQFKLFGIPSYGAQQLPILATAANQLWHTSTGGWFQRQVDQRDVERDDGLGTGTWFNVSGVSSSRDIVTTVPIGASDFDFDNGYDQMDVAVSFGWDLISQNSASMSWSLGAMVGYAQSEVEFGHKSNSANLEGVHGGVYGGLSFSEFFVDAAVNGNWLSLHNDVPALQLIPAGTMLDTHVQSLGARIEAGWRWRSDMLWVEPIAGFSMVTTDFDDFRVPNDDPDLGRPGVGVRLDNADSRRASVGVRVGVDELMGDVAPTSLAFTARHVNEFEGVSDIRIANTGPDALMSDTFDGAFTQLTGSLGISNPTKTISGYLNVDAVTGDDYESLGVSAGLRFQW